MFVTYKRRELNELLRRIRTEVKCRSINIDNHKAVLINF